MKKGFTLIELLAVIVILAIIATIATPIVLSIIEDTKESATLRNAEYYLSAVETSVAMHSLNSDSSYSPKECKIQTDGNLLCDDEVTIEVEVKGTKPSGGFIFFNNSIISLVTLNIENKAVTQNEKNELVIGRITLADYIKRIYKETTTTTVNDIEYSLDEKHLLMNDRLGSNDVEKTEGNIRYYGASPNNYIDIGDRDSDGNIIFWRIIGLFKDVEVTDEDGNVVRTEDLVKIIRAEKLGNFSWDYTSTGEYDNNWHDSTLQVMLNNAYYNSGTTNYYNNSATAKTFDFSSIGLSSNTHSKIERVKWSLGVFGSPNIYLDTMYGYESSETNSWSGKIALMYPSDYGYSSDLSSCQSSLSNYGGETCKTTNWMYDSTGHQWTFISHSTNVIYVYNVHSTGVICANYVYSVPVVRPVLYLKSDVGIVEEKETSEGLKYLVVE